MTVSPAYLALLESGELQARAAAAIEHLHRCDLCPRNCGHDRLAGKLGVCQIGEFARVASYGPHLGEENPLRGWRGSGTIFFAGCSLRCQYCQNHDISQPAAGNYRSMQEMSAQDLAVAMLELQSLGCHNINLVTPTHVVPQILEALVLAAAAGLRLPLVYNTGGYDALETLRLLDGVVDIYLPDMKYSSARAGLHYSKVRDYPAHNQAAVREMHRQVGDLQLDERGLAVRGLIVRHLVLPNDLAGSAEIFAFLAREIGRDTYVNVMGQYRPEFNAARFPRINRPVTRGEVEAAVSMAREAGLRRVDG